MQIFYLKRFIHTTKWAIVLMCCLVGLFRDHVGVESESKSCF